MDSRNRRLVALAVLILSLLIVAYLLFFTPSESTISTPTPESGTSRSHFQGQV